jgi:hypothetical protein
MASENYPDLEKITAAWLDQYPGNAPALVLLRDQFIRANCRLLQSEAALDEALFSAPSAILLRQHAQLERSYQRHYKNLQNYRQPAPKPPAIPEPKPRGPVDLPQEIHIRTLPDGTVTTEFSCENTIWNSLFKDQGDAFKADYIITRRFHFHGGIPEPYRSWPFLANRDPNAKENYVRLGYAIDEFFRLADYEAQHHPEFIVPEPPPDFGRQDIIPYPQVG